MSGSPKRLLLPAGIGLLCAGLLFTGVLLWARRGAPLTIDDPADGTVYPPDLVPPEFLWHDPVPEADRWLVEVTSDGGDPPLRIPVPGVRPSFGQEDPRCFGPTNEPFRPTTYQATARSWTPPDETWEEVRRRGRVTVTISGFSTHRPRRLLSRGEVRLEVSPDPVGAPVFYRDVPLMPSRTEQGTIKPLDEGALPLVTWRLRDLSRPESRVVLKDMPTCANCHSFSRDGRTLGMDIDGPGAPEVDKGGYALATLSEATVIDDGDVFSWNRFPGKPEGTQTIGFLSRVSPDGRHVVTTVNESVYVVNFPDYRFLQVFYPTRGILAVRSRETGEIRPLPGADAPAFVHCDPVWSPDGRTIVFARAPARDPYTEGVPLATRANDDNETPLRYDLFRIPFDGGRGGTPVPIAGASGNGMSNTFPKVSPDGRWIVFVKCANGQLMRPDGRLWIVPFAGGRAREMRCNGSPMNSWHSFSPSGRWLVFSSKRNTPYTQMFLTHLDEAGNDSPAVLVPNSTAANRAVNLPEFVNIPPDGLRSIAVLAVAPRRAYERALELAKQGQHVDAIPLYERALRDKPGYVEARNNLGVALEEAGRPEEAIAHYREALRLEPDDVMAHNNLGLALRQQGRLEEAVEHCAAAVRLSPDSPKARADLGMALADVGRLEEAVGHLEAVVRQEPDRAEAHRRLGIALTRQGRLPEAHARLARAVELAPGSAGAHFDLGNVLVRQGRLEEAAEQFAAALRLEPGHEQARHNLETAVRTLRRRPPR